MAKKDPLLGQSSFPKLHNTSGARQGNLTKFIFALISVVCIGVAFHIGRTTAGQTSDPKSEPPTQRPVQDSKLASPQIKAASNPSATPGSKDIDRRSLVGIWAPLPDGCGTGYGITYTPAGRYIDGDEFGGEEGRWTLTGNEIRRDARLEYETVDYEAKRTKTVRRAYSHKITWLDDDELTIAFENKKFRYTKCPQGRSIFTDGFVFEGPR